MNVQFLGGSPKTTRFSDGLNGASGSMGQSWAVGVVPQLPIVNPIAVPTFSIGAGTDALNHLGIGTNVNGAAATEYWGWAFPLPLATTLMFGKTQFVQMRWFEAVAAGANTESGLVLALRPDGFSTGTPLFSGYLLRWQPTAPVLRVSKITRAGGISNLATGINANTLNSTDVVRFSVDYSVANQATLTVSVNGVQKAQATDAVSPLTGGWGGIWASMQSGTVRWDTFSAGLGV